MRGVPMSGFLGLSIFAALMVFVAVSASARQCWTIDTVHPDGRTFTQCTVCCDDDGRNCTRICV